MRIGATSPMVERFGRVQAMFIFKALFSVETYDRVASTTSPRKGPKLGKLRGRWRTGGLENAGFRGRPRSFLRSRAAAAGAHLAHRPTLRGRSRSHLR